MQGLNLFNLRPVSRLDPYMYVYVYIIYGMLLKYMIFDIIISCIYAQ